MASWRAIKNDQKTSLALQGAINLLQTNERRSSVIEWSDSNALIAQPTWERKKSLLAVPFFQ